MKLVVKTAAEIAAEAADQQLRLVQEEARSFLASTDWMVVRQAETGTPVPPDVSEKRAAARALL